MLMHCRADHFSSGVHQQNACTAGGDVDSEQFHGVGVQLRLGVNARLQSYVSDAVTIAATGGAQNQFRGQHDAPLHLGIGADFASTMDHIEEHACSAASQLECGLADGGERRVQQRSQL